MAVLTITGERYAPAGLALGQPLRAEEIPRPELVVGDELRNLKKAINAEGRVGIPKRHGGRQQNVKKTAVARSTDCLWHAPNITACMYVPKYMIPEKILQSRCIEEDRHTDRAPNVKPKHGMHIPLHEQNHRYSPAVYVSW